MTPCGQNYVTPTMIKKGQIEIGDHIRFEEDILVSGWGVLGIDRKKVRCDYFDYLDGKPGSLNLYRGAYMLQYDWAKRNHMF